MHKLEFHPLVSDDVIKAASFYQDVSHETFTHFKEDLFETYSTLKATPSHYFVLIKSRQIRRIPLKNFPYSIIYTIKKDAVLVLALKHNKQKEAWRKRI